MKRNLRPGKQLPDDGWVTLGGKAPLRCSWCHSTLVKKGYFLICPHCDTRCDRTLCFRCN